MIEAHDIHKSYGALEVLKGVSLRVARGEVVSITGPSGAGKTTLLQIIGTLSTPDSGTVAIDGEEVARLSDFRNRKIGFVFQFHRLLPEFTALENVMLPALIARRGRAEAEREASELLRMMNLAQRADHKPAALSGGEQQRVAIARAPPRPAAGRRAVGKPRLEEPRGDTRLVFPPARRAGADDRDRDPRRRAGVDGRPQDRHARRHYRIET